MTRCAWSRAIRFGLLQRRLEGTRIELSDQTAWMHGLTFDEADLLNGSGDLGVHVDNVVGHHRADAGHDNREVGNRDLRGNHRNRWREYGVGAGDCAALMRHAASPARQIATVTPIIAMGFDTCAVS